MINNSQKINKCPHIKKNYYNYINNSRFCAKEHLDEINTSTFMTTIDLDEAKSKREKALSRKRSFEENLSTH